MLLKLRALLLAACCLGPPGSPFIRFAQSDEIHNHPLSIIVPFPAGGVPDILARILSEELSPQLSQPVRVENRPGSSGTIGAAFVARSVPDGQTLLLAENATITIAPHLYRHVRYDPASQLTPVAPLVEGISVLYVGANLPVRSLTDLVNHARAAQPMLAYASAGTGSVSHLAMERLLRMGGFPLLHVPYKSAVLASAAVAGSEVAVLLAGSSAEPYLQLDKLRPIASASLSRTAANPRLPTISETFPGFHASVWYGLFAPAGTPGPLIERIELAVGRALALPSIRKRLAGAGNLQPIAMSRLKFADSIREESIAYSAIVARLFLSPE